MSPPNQITVRTETYCLLEATILNTSKLLGVFSSDDNIRAEWKRVTQEENHSKWDSTFGHSLLIHDITLLRTHTHKLKSVIVHELCPNLTLYGVYDHDAPVPYELSNEIISRTIPFNTIIDKEYLDICCGLMRGDAVRVVPRDLEERKEETKEN